MVWEIYACLLCPFKKEGTYRFVFICRSVDGSIDLENSLFHKQISYTGSHWNVNDPYWFGGDRIKINQGSNYSGHKKILFALYRKDPFSSNLVYWYTLRSKGRKARGQITPDMRKYWLLNILWTLCLREIKLGALVFLFFIIIIYRHSLFNIALLVVCTFLYMFPKRF